MSAYMLEGPADDRPAGYPPPVVCACGAAPHVSRNTTAHLWLLKCRECHRARIRRADYLAACDAWLVRITVMKLEGQ